MKGNIDPAWFVITTFAVWRLSSLFAREEGPGGMFNKIRAITARISKPIWDGMICMWCNSIWFGMIAALFFAHSFAEWFILFLGFSAASLLFEALMQFLGLRMV